MAHNRFKCAPKKNIPIEVPLERARAMASAHMATAPARISQDHWNGGDNKLPDAPNILVDAVSLGGQAKPLVRHVIVKDLHKIASRMNHRMPREGVFKNKAPMGLFSLFDGQSCAGTPGPLAAEFCARNFHTILMENLSKLPDPADVSSVLNALSRVFKTLDEEILHNHPEITDGCGAAVVLLVGDWIFTANLGQCSSALCSMDKGAPKAWTFDHTYKGVLDCDASSFRKNGNNPVVEDATGRYIVHPNGSKSRVSRSLGDRSWKVAPDVDVALIWSGPEVKSWQIRRAEHPFVLLAASSVLVGTSPQELIDMAQEFPMQPRAACGEMATHASTACMKHLGEKAQCTLVQICFLPERGAAAASAQPPAKKAKTDDTQSMRLRHILMKYSDAPNATADDKNKVSRTRHEVEARLRQAIGELRKDMQAAKNPKDPNDVVSKSTAKFGALCRELSECETAKKAGIMCGDLGWVTPAERASYGAGFKDVVDVLTPGQLSDLAVSSIGLHLVQRMA